MNTLVLNRTNLLDNGKNNTLVYRFPRSVQFKDAEIAVSQVSMYYSWYNISAALGNNTFSYTWVNGDVKTITLPDGLYEIADVNSFLQSEMIKNNHYLVNASGNFVYYISLEVNATRYAVQINTFKVPTSNEATAASLTDSSGSFPFRASSANTQRFNPVVTIPAGFNNIIGFDEGFATDANLGGAFTAPANQTYISISDAGTYSAISHSYPSNVYLAGTPDVQPNSSVLINIDKVINEYAQPTGILYSVVPNVAIGALINERPAEYAFAKLVDGTYNELRVQFLGTDLQEISIQDPEITLLLVIKNASS